MYGGGLINMKGGTIEPSGNKIGERWRGARARGRRGRRGRRTPSNKTQAAFFNKFEELIRGPIKYSDGTEVTEEGLKVWLENGDAKNQINNKIQLITDEQKMITQKDYKHFMLRIRIRVSLRVRS